MIIGISNYARIVNIFGVDIGRIAEFNVGLKIQEIFSSCGEIGSLSLGEFGLLLNKNVSIEELTYLTLKLMNYFDEPIRFSNVDLSLSLAVGATNISSVNFDMQTYINQAHLAFRKAVEETNINEIQWYDEDIEEEITYLQNIEKYMLNGIENNEFRVVLQPQYTSSNECCGYEALLRWNNDILGNISPDVFIKIAEENGLISKLGDFVLDNVCNVILKMKENLKPTLRISINVSYLEIISDSFVQRLLNKLSYKRIDMSLIHLEVTETSISKYSQDAKKNLEVLSSLGFKVELDDFGTGYSSLTHLGTLPFNVVKIDKSFVDKMLNDSRISTLVRMIIDTAHEFDMEVIAEGVETKEQVELLNSYKCDIYQGYYFSKPLEISQIL